MQASLSMAISCPQHNVSTTVGGPCYDLLVCSQHIFIVKLLGASRKTKSRSGTSFRPQQWFKNHFYKGLNTLILGELYLFCADPEKFRETVGHFWKPQQLINSQDVTCLNNLRWLKSCLESTVRASKKSEHV